MNKCKEQLSDEQPLNENCNNVVTRYIEVGVPADIKPYAAIEGVETRCCNSPSVSVKPGSCCGSCKITVSQLLSVKICLAYGVTVDAGDLSVNCREICQDEIVSLG